MPVKTNAEDITGCIYSINSDGNWVDSTCLERPIDAVHKERMMHMPKKTTANQAVKDFNTSAVDVPNKESLAAPPKEAPRPELLLSWIRMTKQSTTQTRMNREIAAKYKNVPINFPFKF